MVKAIQVNNTFITFNDNKYTLTDNFGDPNGHFIVKLTADGSKVCTVYSEGIVKWDNPPAANDITVTGQHLRINIP